MTISVDVWIRGTDFAITKQITTVTRAPDAWLDEDVRAILEGMLHAMDEAKHPGQPNRVSALRGFSWIVNPFEGGVIIAIEMTLGAAVVGPFAVDKARLEAIITRVLASSTPPTVVH
ncbi:MAG TPA: hypothetical protein VLV86_25745 [Vicinamibacterales bacterium]|nr:hypothetical protein [Vicinamibacterales bacterium]